MRPRCKISIPLTCFTGVFAIALSIVNPSAFAQSPAASSQAASAAPSAVVTTAPQPAAATSPSAAHASTGAHSPDARAVISYLSDVINWYGHLGVEAQLVRDPDETLFFADDRQTAGAVLRLAFEYARAQAAFIAKAAPSAAAAVSGGKSSVTAGSSDTTHRTATLDAAANALRARIKDLQAQLAKAPARQ